MTGQPYTVGVTDPAAGPPPESPERRDDAGPEPEPAPAPTDPGSWDAVVSRTQPVPVVPAAVPAPPVVPASALPPAGTVPAAGTVPPTVEPIDEPLAESFAPTVDPQVADPAPLLPAAAAEPVAHRRARRSPLFDNPVARRFDRFQRARLGGSRHAEGRTIRHVDPWTVARVSFLLYCVLYVVVLVAMVLLWAAASTVGLVGDIEELIAELWSYEDSYAISASMLLRASVLLGAVLVAAGTGFNVLATVVFNLISDVVGGIRVTVLDDGTATD